MHFRLNINVIYSLALLFFLLKIVNCEKTNKHCKGNDCLINNPKQLKNKYTNGNNYEEIYKKKYEKYVAAKQGNSQSMKKSSLIQNINAAANVGKECNKRKYQLNCNKTWQKSKNGEGSTKNSKRYIKRENNLLSNIEDENNNLKRKKQGFQRPAPLLKNKEKEKIKFK